MGGGAKAGGEANGVRMVGDVKLMARAVSGIDIKDLKSLADEGKKQLGSGVVALVGVTEDGKAGIVVGVTDDLTARFNAVDLVRKGAEALGGKGGGGRPDMAQAGGPDGAKADAALDGDRGRARRLAHEQGVESRARHGIDTQALLDHVVRRRVERVVEMRAALPRIGRAAVCAIAAFGAEECQRLSFGGDSVGLDEGRVAQVLQAGRRVLIGRARRAERPHLDGVGRKHMGFERIVGVLATALLDRRQRRAEGRAPCGRDAIARHLVEAEIALEVKPDIGWRVCGVRRSPLRSRGHERPRCSRGNRHPGASSGRDRR